MKGKLLVGLALISISSTNGFTMDISKGKLISHHEWTTDNRVKIKLEETNKTLKNSVLSSKNADILSGSFDRIIVENKMSDTIGTAGAITNLLANDITYISNDSSSPHNYKINTVICTTYDSTGGTACGSVSDEFTLEPQGQVTLSRSPVLSLIYNMPGTYSTYTETYVLREDKTTLFSGASESYADISDVKNPNN
ncbi:MAG: hypothetical protein ACYCQI_08485 [Gammaproteobacteria bacterium]